MQNIINELIDDYDTDLPENIKRFFKEYNLTINKEFCDIFIGELIKIFGIDSIIPDATWLLNYEIENVDGMSKPTWYFKKQIESFLSQILGTSGWETTFHLACMGAGITDLYYFYNELTFEESEIFDTFIADLTIKTMFYDYI